MLVNIQYVWMFFILGICLGASIMLLIFVLVSDKF